MILSDGSLLSLLDFYNKFLPSRIFSLHRHGFREISRAVHIQSPEHAHPVGKELERDYRETRGKERLCLREENAAVRSGEKLFLPSHKKRIETASPALHLRHIGPHLLEKLRLTENPDHGYAFFNQADRPVLQFSGRVGLCVDVA